MNIMAIDPGKGGGICFISSKGQFQLGKMVEGNEFYEYLIETQAQYGPFVCFLERVSSWRGEMDETPQKRFGLDKMLANYNKTINTLEIANVPYSLVSPVTWQGYLAKLGVKKSRYKNPKNAFKAFAITKFPRAFKLITLATADAACIAWYGRNLLKTNPTDVFKSVENQTKLKLLL